MASLKSVLVSALLEPLAAELRAPHTKEPKSRAAGPHHPPSRGWDPTWRLGNHQDAKASGNIQDSHLDIGEGGGEEL